MGNAIMTIAHGKPNGTGVAMRMEIHPAHGLAVGSVFVSIAKQFGDPALGGIHRFDWGNANSANLMPTDVAEFLMVLRGYQESIADGKGIFIRRGDGNAVFRAWHQFEPVNRFGVSLDFTPKGGELRKMVIDLTLAEMMVLQTALSGAMTALVFG